MQHNPGQQKRHEGTTQGIDPDSIKVMPKRQAPSLNRWQADRKQGPKDEQGRRVE
ncbi:hypothetical protein [Aeromonas caviae]|uniref:Uncharacterized protein n=1 Tax=Aeromonas caviae TaxID=648 RepID=A0AA42VCN7_AERCA|nr:hypothetical protein [Aeromonas caviae]MDH1898755.1 hypothetical protein [Aeromonas caviae]